MTAPAKQRSSNIELLRILSMFLVLVLHANFLGIGVPTPEECAATPINAYFRFFIESLSIVAIDVFVMISGWFGIKPSLKRLCSLLFQILFFTVSLLLVFCLIKGRSVVTLNSVLRLFMITKGYWFIKSYLCLFILSPVLNLFVEKASQNTFKWVLIGFFAFQTIYGWTDSAPEFFFGYSTLSFIGLYLLARYLRFYPVRILSNRKICIVTYFAISFFVAFCIWYLMKADFHTKYTLPIVFSYINPVLILSSVALLFTFINTDMAHSKVINWIAISSFAVFIIHTNEFIMPYYRSAVWFFYSNFSPILRGLLILLFLILVFLSCVLLDKIRLFIWHKVERLFDGRDII